MIAKYQKIQWTNEAISLLGTMPDKSLGLKVGIRPFYISKKRKELKISRFSLAKVWTEEELALLGTMPDQQLANKLELSNTAVYYKRIEHKIRAKEPKHPRYANSMWSKEMLELLGTMPDVYFAKKFSISNRLIALKRKELKIPIHTRCICEPYGTIIEKKFEQGLTIVQIHKFLVKKYQFEGSCDIVQLFVKASHPEDKRQRQFKRNK